MIVGVCKINIFLYFVFIITFLHTPVFVSQSFSQEKLIKNIISDDDVLLFRPRVHNYVYDYDVAAFKKGDIFYYSLLDIIDVLNLPVEFDDETGRGQGWFGREDRKISIDLKRNEVVIDGLNKNIDTSLIILKDEGYFIAEAVFNDVFSLGFIEDIGQQYVDVVSDYPLPDVTRYYRGARGNKKLQQASTLPRHPRYNSEYDWFDINVANVRLGSRFSNEEGGQSFFHRGTVAVEGDLLKHAAYGFVNADSLNKVNSASLRLSKFSENPDLLGVLKARRYAVGDTNVVDVPLTGSAGQELGVRISNSQSEDVNIQTTNITGNALPNWDIELYRNNILISFLTVEEDGFYEFDNIELFRGDNKFELFFYGPQGEIRTRKIDIPVTSNFLKSKSGTYDVSLSLNETQLYQRVQPNNQSRETPHFVLRYNHSIGNLLGYVGYRNRQINGVQKNVFAFGGTQLIGRSLVDANFGFDENLNSAMQLSLRQNINKWSTTLSAQIQDADYQVTNNDVVTTLDLRAAAQKSYAIGRGKRLNVNVDTGYEESSSDVRNVTTTIRHGVQLGKLGVNNSINYNKFFLGEGGSNTRIDNNFSLRSYYKNFFLRGGANYNIKPLNEIERLFAQVNYYPSQSLSTDLRFDYEPVRDYSNLRFSMNHTNKYFRTSPFVEYDSDNDLRMGVNLNFDIVDLPHKTTPQIMADRNIGRGLVSAFVYHDKDGNYKFDGDDEPLPDTLVKSVNVRKQAFSDKQGYALLSALPTQRVTDIELDEDTLPDLYMMAGKHGYSLRPRQGDVAQFEFPVHLSGEIDGTLSTQTKTGDIKIAKHGEIEFHPLQKTDIRQPKTVHAAFDGFYVASKIPPGEYLVNLSSKTIKKHKAGNPPPQKITIGYDGKVIYGMDFQMDKKQGQVPVRVEYDVNPTPNMIPILYVKKKTDTKLLGLLGKLQGTHSDTYAGLIPIKDREEHYKLAHNDIEAAHEKCRVINERAIPCQLIIQMPENVQTTQNNIELK